MKDEVLRRFTLMDAMILVAASGLALPHATFASRQLVGVIVDIRDQYARSRQEPSFRRFERQIRFDEIQEYLGLALSTNFTLNALIPFLVCYSPALIVARVLRPRPRFGDMLRQPGFVACVGGLLTLYLSMIVAGYVGGNWYRLTFGVVPMAWMALALGGNWRPVSDWVDRAGRVVGVAWLYAALMVGRSLLKYGL